MAEKIKKKRHFLAWLILFVLIVVVGMSLGSSWVLANISSDGTLSPFLQSLKETTGTIGPYVLAFVNKIKEIGFPAIAKFQTTITLTGSLLGIIVAIKTLRKK
jgi:ABC-type phosphate/phosphonate transport system permease subunit